MEKRDDTRMLGGMVALPTTYWDIKSNKNNNLKHFSNVLPSKAKVHHSFTHFDLELVIADAVLQSNPNNNAYFWQNKHEFNEEILPTVFKKVWKLKVES